MPIMHLETKETTQLYSLLSDRLGIDTAEAMFKYIDNKTGRSVEETVKLLVTKDDFTKVKHDLSKEINKANIATIKWMSIF